MIVILLFEFSKLPVWVYFPSIKFNYVEETRMMLVALWRWRKLLQHISVQKMTKQNFCQVFDTDSDMKMHALQIFQSKLKLLQTRQTGGKNKELSKVEIGCD